MSMTLTATGDIDGYRFDGGPTVITAPRIFDEIWQAAGRRRQDYLRLVACDPFYRIFDHNYQPFDFSADHDVMLRQIARRSPGGCRGLFELHRRHAQQLSRLSLLDPANIDAERLVPSAQALGGCRQSLLCRRWHASRRRCGGRGLFGQNCGQSDRRPRGRACACAYCARCVHSYSPLRAR